MAKPRVLVTTVPFGEFDDKPLRILEEAGVETVVNPTGRKLTSEQAAEMIESGFDAVVAGTETISAEVMDRSPNLKLIARVGIGLDSVDLNAARDRDITVAYTPDAPSAAVGELTIGMMIDLLRGVSKADRDLRQGVWRRIMGRRVSEMTVGIVGVGRIGKRVIEHLSGGFPGVTLLADDLTPDRAFGERHGLRWADKEEIYRTCDVVSLHLPLTGRTRDLIAADQLAMMGKETILLNTARGGIVNEAALAEALRSGSLYGAGIDVFETEPYVGELAQIENCLLTCHMGSMSRDCRTRMEIEACEEVARFFTRAPLANPVPENEFEISEFMWRG